MTFGPSSPGGCGAERPRDGVVLTASAGAQNGPVTLSIVAGSDTGGGTYDLTPASFNVTIFNPDSTPPVTTLTALTRPGGTPIADGAITNQDVDLILNATDTGSGFGHFDITDSVDGVDFTFNDLDNNPTTYFATLEGAHVFTYAATDVADNAETPKTFTFTIDKTAPSITAPGDITVNATSPSGAYVDYPAPVVSDNLTTVTTDCDYDSGSLFPVGTTTVTCTATDEATNASQDTFTVTVVGADGQLDELYAMVEQTPISGTASTANSVRRNLLSMVRIAQGLEASGYDSMSCLMLTRLELEIRSQVSKRRISTSDAQALWTKIDKVQAAIGCGGSTPT